MIVHRIPSNRLPFLVALAFAGACAEPKGPGKNNEPTTGDPSPTLPGTGYPGSDSGLTTGIGGGTPTTSPIDCLALPTTPGAVAPVPAARGSYDLIFDDQGYIYGWNNGLVRADYYGNAQMVAPTLGITQGMAWLPDGDLVVAEIGTQALVRVNVTTGGTSLITTDVPAYGLKMGPDDMIYVGTDDKLMRIDPATGDRELLLDDQRFNARSIDWAPDYSKLYIGTYFGDGRFWAQDFDANMNMVGDPYVFHPNVGNGTEHDAVGVDYCGNVFVVDYGTLTMYRLTPDGQKAIFQEFTGSHYGHGITWGSGVGGWKDTAIYLPEPWFGNTVIEIEVGVPSRSWTP